MARSSRSSSRMRSAKRDYPRIANRVPLFRPMVRALPVPGRMVRAIEDRRRYHPLQAWAQPAALPRSAAHVSLDPRVKRDVLRFVAPRRVAMCVRRHIRQEVLIARGAGGSRKRKRRGPYSSISCKR